MFRFLEKYLSQLEGPVANQVWNRFMQLIKEVVTGLKDLKLQGYYTLRFAPKLRSTPVCDSPNNRCLTVLADKVVQTTALDERRLRKELQVRAAVGHCNFFRLNPVMEENYGKLVDSCVISVSRLDPGTWIRRTTKDTLSAANGRDSPISRGTPYCSPWLLVLHFCPVASDSKLDETFSANPWDSKPHPEAETGEQVPLFSP